VWCTFTEPELAHAGLNEAEAREKYGDSIRIYRHSYDEIDRARTDLADVGLSKFICDKKGKLVGIHILGERAAELLHQAQLAKTLGVPFRKIQSMIHIYPTYGDLVKRPATAAFADKLQNNFFVKQLRRLTS
jgi:pyruvate/2-oxoglutarate dehydrogenase complex dihydrolipoamide dehydrogenase (E3) component